MLHIWSSLWAAPLLAMVIAQGLKPIFVMIQLKSWDWRQIKNSGGMPSSHTAAVVALAVQLWLHLGGSDPVVAIGLFLAAVVMYDAAGVRWQTGRQAAVLNRLLHDLRGQHLLMQPGEHAASSERTDRLQGDTQSAPVLAGRSVTSHEGGTRSVEPLRVAKGPWWLVDWPVLNEQVGHKPNEIAGGAIVGMLVAFALNH
ncbi:divergent PAP2 family protein [Alicyclobacillus mali]|uniref:Divergent PAP2 family protein n=1 Tax=Alicyclobacillus mali (ex Roth et al. 2021) TaxID=1123961 RepID=A0ABS0F6I9_9BACL|nr:divergent PAP2 family protein [Alicyclobacillus mali (ex Roth et al. 2021)]MBF8378912.1 divergent PAP2 family protein [Alicyclobacillus mali (ex Roth et al. 2021)]MCL6489694.1 divergent PAP2 family protein [Alicyclobacillus mali (ex Roth et al. 2021)]